MNYLPTCTSRLVVQHPCQVSFKSMQGCRRSLEDKVKCVKVLLSVKDHNCAKICRTWISSLHAILDLWCNIPAKFLFKSMQGCRRSWVDKLKCVKIPSVKDHNSAKIGRTLIISPTCTFRLVVKHPCQVSSKSMQGCRRSLEDKLKCVKSLSVKDITLSKFVEHELSPHMHF